MKRTVFVEGDQVRTPLPKEIEIGDVVFWNQDACDSFMSPYPKKTLYGNGYLEDLGSEPFVVLGKKIVTYRIAEGLSWEDKVLSLDSLLFFASNEDGELISVSYPSIFFRLKESK